MVASGTTIRPIIGSACDRFLWNSSGCHVCDLYEGIRHPRMLEHLPKYYYGLTCVPKAVEDYWVRHKINVCLTCDASADEHCTISVILTPHEGPEDYVFPRRQYVVVVHALYFRDSARAEAAAQTLAQIVALRCERLKLHASIWNDNKTQALETYTEHCQTRVRATPPWNMLRRSRVRTDWPSLIQLGYRLAPVGFLLREEIPEADSWARGPRGSRGTNRMPQSRVRWKTCRWCLWEQCSAPDRYRDSYDIPEPEGYIPSMRRCPQSIIATQRVEDPRDPTCVVQAVREAVKLAFAHAESLPVLWATQADCMCWLEDACTYTVMFNQRLGTDGLDNTHPAMVCLHSAAKLAMVSISFEWWNDTQLLPVMQIGTFQPCSMFFRVLCMSMNSHSTSSSSSRYIEPGLLICVYMIQTTPFQSDSMLAARVLHLCTQPRCPRMGYFQLMARCVPKAVARRACTE